MKLKYCRIVYTSLVDWLIRKNMGKEKFYITTPIYYANGSPHIGHFLTTTIADVIARYWRLSSGAENVFFTTGLDEHGTTVEQSAAKEGYELKNIQKYVDKRALEWKKVFDDTNISYDYFVRTTNKRHEQYAQKFIKKMVDANDVYKDTYKGKYCNGCEKFLTLSDQDESGNCPLHRPDQVIETEEDNHFFKLSKYAPEIKKLIEKDKIKIFPESKKNEMLSRLSEKVEDVSISRPKEKVAWGVEFPGDSKQTIYVWVEALMNYTSSLEINNKKGFWSETRHTLGKDINWFHNVIWPAFLLSANKSLYKNSFVHGFLSIGGTKISKSLGNVITPKELVDKYDIDGARYLTLSNLPYKSDSDVTWKHLDQKYNADLANGIGNLVSRVAKLCERSGFEFEQTEEFWYITSDIDKYCLDEVLRKIWLDIRAADYVSHKTFGVDNLSIKGLDQHINKTEPWTLEGKELKENLTGVVSLIRNIAYNLKPFLPDTAEKIEKQFKGPKIKSQKPLFPRLK